jgi:hypothetical protein
LSRVIDDTGCERDIRDALKAVLDKKSYKNFRRE